MPEPISPAPKVAQLAALTDEALGDLIKELKARLEAIKNGETVSSEDLDSLKEITAEIDAIEAEVTGRAEAKAMTASLSERFETITKAAPVSQIQVSEKARPIGRPTTQAQAITASGQPVNSSHELAEAFVKKFQALKGVQDGDGRHSVASMSFEFPENRTLGADPALNRRRLESVIGPDALVASGGLCAPTEGFYAQQVIASSARPVRDGLPVFKADRGGIRYNPPPTLSDVSAGVGVWTHANDVLPVNPLNKGCAVATCKNEAEVKVSAIYQCLTFGNFQAIFNPEQIQSLINLLMAEHARRAELTLLSRIAANSTATTSSVVLGAARDVLATLDEASAGFRSRNRTLPGTWLSAIFPGWVKDLMRADITRQMPGDGHDSLGIADATIERWFASRYVRPIWSLDAQVFPSQGAAPLRDFPDEVQWWLFSEGKFVFLDGGVLDLGVVRDAESNKKNNASSFAETFEEIAPVGAGESLQVTQTVCPTGSVAQAVTSILCPAGS